jgi:hypothetical protein
MGKENKLEDEIALIKKENEIDSSSFDSSEDISRRLREGLTSFEQIELQNTGASVEIENEEEDKKLEGEDYLDSKTGHEKQKAPLWAWLLLLLALFFVSSAATVLKFLQDVKPLLRASWRLQVSRNGIPTILFD